MNKKKIATIVVSVLAVAVLAVGSTLAYFTSQSSASNVFTTGNVEIELRETKDQATAINEDDGSEWTTDGLTYGEETPLTPGADIIKNAVIDNTGANDSYLKVNMEIAFDGDLSQAEQDALTAAIKEAVKSDFEEGSNGYWYYNDILTTGSSIQFMDEFTIPGEEITTPDSKFTITLTAYAIQSDNVDRDNEWFDDAAVPQV